ncbi:AMP nucleosidase [Aureimonas phyllosphaerae]|uniref:AMP nucleosidase n=1 Tax=Aureimonas phyllosphaerae TaxID=1166078 RepID=A0A7W6BVL2_9HYPH|nr:AMP nucleosidase [Aureimonas phyllosphaerae]MBB3934526.1 AMP nucleosidase [Aureimonas phyllosphaerae]MBB3958258.1 AMP nucleosidase [Aureimonas phyllosphaerae]SFE94344.1 AMP nucleosidase [Aureimonas phyllosphaerae]
MTDRFAQPAHEPLTPPPIAAKAFLDAEAAVEELRRIYAASVEFLCESFDEVLETSDTSRRYRAFYPQVAIRTAGHARVDSRLSFGFVPGPGHYATTITRPELFGDYLVQQFEQLLKNHGQPIEVGLSKTPIPLHFALPEGTYVDGARAERLDKPLRDIFDVPDLEATDDRIVNGNYVPMPGEPLPLAPFTAQRVDYSLLRLTHYTATSPQHFQNFVLFTNYQFYVDEFCAMARSLMEDGGHGYESFVEPGNVVTLAGAPEPERGFAPQRMPQMPAYHLTRPGSNGITMINIGVGPSNAKTITDHVAVLRPHAWLMLGHCAGLRNTQALGDYVLAHAYVREDHVLDADLPAWVPIPPLAEVQVALEQAVADVTGLEGYDLKRIMRTGTVATIDNRNWELRDQTEPVERLSKSRAVALDMESATIAANGYRLRVPYGTLLCVSDKPLHGELKLPGMATEFYKRQVAQHLQIGIRAMQSLADMPVERLHSRKLRSFFESAFQ